MWRTIQLSRSSSLRAMRRYSERRSSSTPSRPARSRQLRIDCSGLFTSWAIEAIIRPIAASFSVWTRRCCERSTSRTYDRRAPYSLAFSSATATCRARMMSVSVSRGPRHGGGGIPPQGDPLPTLGHQPDLRGGLLLEVEARHRAAQLPAHGVHHARPQADLLGFAEKRLGEAEDRLKDPASSRVGAGPIRDVRLLHLPV